MSSIYTYANGRSHRILSINRWNVWAALESPNGMYGNLNKPNGVITAVFSMSSGATGIW